MWDDDNLYFAAVVKVRLYVNEANDIDIWQNDNIAFGIHPWGWKLGSKINTGYYREAPGPLQRRRRADLTASAILRRAAQRAGRIDRGQKSEGRLCLRMVAIRAPRSSPWTAEGKRFRLSMGLWDGIGSGRMESPSR